MLTDNSKLSSAQDKTICFEDGILGFEDTKEYLLLNEDDRNLLFTFQAAGTGVPSLIVLNPFEVLDDYEPLLSKRDLDYFDGGGDELSFLLIAMLVGGGDCVVNLKAPLVIHPETRKGRQVILENAYPVRHTLFRR